MADIPAIARRLCPHYGPAATQNSVATQVCQEAAAAAAAAEEEEEEEEEEEVVVVVVEI